MCAKVETDDKAFYVDRVIKDCAWNAYIVYIIIHYFFFFFEAILSGIT